MTGTSGEIMNFIVQICDDFLHSFAPNIERPGSIICNMCKVNIHKTKNLRTSDERLFPLVTFPLLEGLLTL